MKKPEDAYEGEWDFDGACAPAENGSDSRYIDMETFSLGCFQWVRRRDGKGLKKGKVMWRVRGDVHNPAPAYKAARAYCDRWNARQDHAAQAQERRK